MKNQKLMVNQNFFRITVAKLSKQHFLAIVVKPMGLESGPERARTETPVQFTVGHDIPRRPIDGHGEPMAPIPGRDASAMVNR